MAYRSDDGGGALDPLDWLAQQAYLQQLAELTAAPVATMPPEPIPYFNAAPLDDSPESFYAPLPEYTAPFEPAPYTTPYSETEEFARSQQVPFEDVYGPVANAERRGGEQFRDQFDPNEFSRPDVFSPSLQPSRQPDPYQTYRAGERAPDPTDPTRLANDFWTQGAGIDPAGQARSLGMWDTVGSDLRGTSLGGAVGQGFSDLGTAAAATGEGAHAFASAGAAIPHILADEGIRNRYNEITRELARKSGREENDPFVRMAAGAQVQSERPNAFTIPLRDMVGAIPGFQAASQLIDKGIQVGEKGLSEAALDPFNLVGGAGFERAAVKAITGGVRATGRAMNAIPEVIEGAVMGRETAGLGAGAFAKYAPTPRTAMSVAPTPPGPAVQPPGPVTPPVEAIATPPVPVPIAAPAAAPPPQARMVGSPEEIAEIIKADPAKRVQVVQRLQELDAALTANGHPSIMRLGTAQPPVADTVDTRQFSRSLGAFEADIGSLLHAQGIALADKIERATAPMSWGELLSLADEISKPALQLMKDIPQRGDLVSKIARVQQDIDVRLAAVKATGEKGLDASQDEVLAALLQAREADALRVTLEGGASEIGRALSSMRAKVEAYTRAPSKAQYEAALKDLVNGNAEKARTILNAIAVVDDPMTIRGIIADTLPITGHDKLLEYIQGNLLWSLKTHEVNSISGLKQVIAYTAKAGLMDPKHLPNTLHGLMMGYKDALSADTLAAAWRGEDFATRMGVTGGSGRLSALVDIQGPSKAILDEDLWGAGRVIGPVQRFPRRILSLMDILQRLPIYKAEMYRRAANAADAAHVGLLDPQRGAWMTKWASEAPVEDKVGALHTANEFALYGKGKTIAALSKFRRGAPLGTGALFMPFVQVSVNLPKIGLRLSPLGLARIPYRLGRKAMGKESRGIGEVVAESGVIGGAATTYFALQLDMGDMTGLQPRSEGERNIWEAEGRQALSIRASEYPIVGPLFRAFMPVAGVDPTKTWVTAGMLGPFLYPAMVAAIGQEVLTGNSKYPLEERVVGAVKSAGRTMLGQLPLYSGLDNVNRLFEAQSGFGYDDALRSVTDMMRPLIPEVTLLGFIRGLLDGIKRDPDTAFERIAKDMPYFSEMVNPAVDVLGRDVRAQLGGVRGVEGREPHPVLNEMSRHMREDHDFKGLGKVGDKVSNFELSAYQHYRYQKLVGQSRDEIMSLTIASETYQNATGAKQRKMLMADEAKAVESGRKALGLEIALTATETEAIATGVLIATKSENTRERGATMAMLGERGKLDLEVVREIDRSRGPIQVGTVKPVIDGDGVEVEVDGKSVNIRVIGINAPEKRVSVEELIAQAKKNGQTLSTSEATKKRQEIIAAAAASERATREFLADKNIEVMPIKDLPHGRVAGEIYANGEPLSEYLVSNGFAAKTFYEKDSKDLTVADLVEGHNVVQQHAATPPYTPRRMQELAARGVDPKSVEQAAAIYRSLIKAAEDDGKDQPWNTDPELKTFYAREAGGFLKEIYAVNGLVKTANVSADRLELQKHPLWEKFR